MSCLFGVCERGEGETDFLLTGGAWVGLDESVVSGPKGELATLILMLHQGCNSGG